MTQNIYDNDEFFKGYGQLNRSVQGLDGAPEWPSLRAMLPNIEGRRILDLGCGFGWFCRFARQHGAGSVLGVDVSEKMLARGKAETKDPLITYRKADLEQLELNAGAFDLVFSSLVFHYIEKLDRLMAEVHKSLLPGGHFVFSVEHPIYTAPKVPGWFKHAEGHRIWPVDG
ncbi:class I SAM-dependent methyltransferase [Paenibacillus sp. DMB20]|uniref:class I SAM-dependent methyltransferase n=1 Tax=Paenibacillus sp. DMB20 TaxID=1642570 RepID=UPI001F1A6FE4|nr:class I SAM-dependent methyltransferase [Paenibacillus sp. DMB20]